jgi:hypothetical protein
MKEAEENQREKLKCYIFILSIARRRKRIEERNILLYFLLQEGKRELKRENRKDHVLHFLLQKGEDLGKMLV